ncbi:MAG: dipeptidase PepV [Culicoidibacterales bacterium]
MTQTLNFQALIDAQRENILRDTKEFVAIPSVKDMTTASETAPFGKEIQRALEWVITKVEADGYTYKNVDNHAMHIEFGSGSELIGILGHLDVVPEGEGWTHAPFGGEIVDGKMYGRGTSDDKGPIIATYYAIQALLEAGVTFNKRVRIIIGCDEETTWKCMDRYFQTEEQPTFGFSPDANFPIVNAEKGITMMEATKTFSQLTTGVHTLIEIHTGTALNVVPEYTVLKFTTTNLEALTEACQTAHTIAFDEATQIVTITFKGKPYHAKDPHLGVNSFDLALAAITPLALDANGETIKSLFQTYLAADPFGKKMGIFAEDDFLGTTTNNVGVIQYDGKQLQFGMNIRYPKIVNFDTDIYPKVESALATYGVEVVLKKHTPATYVDHNEPFIQTLFQVYEKHTGQKATPKAIGGGTYAKVLEKGVCFGPNFPEDGDTRIHQADEFIPVESLIKAAVIYAEAIYELTR